MKGYGLCELYIGRAEDLNGIVNISLAKRGPADHFMVQHLGDGWICVAFLLDDSGRDAVE